MDNKSEYLFRFNPYNCFGLREEWIINYFKLNNNFFSSNYLGPVQLSSFINYLKDIKLINSDKNITFVFEILNRLFKNYIKNKLCIWAIIWSNLSNKSMVFNIWLNFYNGIYDKNSIIQRLVKEYGDKNRHLMNGYYALIGTLEQTPIGKELKQGIVIKEKRERIVIKEGNPDIPSEVVLYNLFRFAEETNIYNFSIKEIENNSFSPQKIFCLSTEKTESLLRSLWNIDFYDVEYTQNSLKIKLNQKYSSLDVLKYIGEKYEV